VNFPSNEEEEARRRRRRRRRRQENIGIAETPSGRWRAEICQGGTCLYLGTFDTELEAAQAYDKAARLIPGKISNFPSRQNEVVVVGAPASVRRYKGIFKTASGRWQVQMKQGGKTVHLGTFDTELEAAQAYDKAARLIPGRKLNFPSSQNEVLVDAPSVTTVDVMVSHQDDGINDVILNDHSEDDDDDNDDSDDDDDDDDKWGVVQDEKITFDDVSMHENNIICKTDSNSEDNNNNNSEVGGLVDDPGSSSSPNRGEGEVVETVGYSEHNGETVLKYFESESEAWAMHENRVCVCVLFT
jgi:hypothetical protein